MDGIHDLGGRQGFGPVRADDAGPVFRDRWEASVFTMMRAAYRSGAASNGDQIRHAIERIDPVAYLTHGYYGRWLGGLETLLREAGVVDLAALEARLRELGGEADDPAARPGEMVTTATPLTTGGSRAGSRRELTTVPAFAVGARVRTRAFGHGGHTRLPAYARGRSGVVAAHHGGWVLPDSNAHQQGECPEHLYTVAFTGAELWGDDGEADVTVSLDLFESYLRQDEEHADERR